MKVRELYGNFFVVGLESNKVSSMLMFFSSCLSQLVVVGEALDKYLGIGEPLML